MRQVVLVLHNIRSAHNVGSMLRTAEGLGVSKVLMSGYTPYPLAKNDSRLPHLASKINHRIKKTALGAETMIEWEYIPTIKDSVFNLKQSGYEVVALELRAG